MGFVLEIENSFLPERIRKDKYGNFLTTKKDSESHGIGLKSVKRMVEKYHGDMSINIKDNILCKIDAVYIERRRHGLLRSVPFVLWEIMSCKANSNMSYDKNLYEL